MALWVLGDVSPEPIIDPIAWGEVRGVDNELVVNHRLECLLYHWWVFLVFVNFFLHILMCFYCHIFIVLEYGWV